MYVNVVVFEPDDTVVVDYVMDYSNQYQRRVLAIQTMSALESGQIVETRRVGRNGENWRDSPDYKG